MTGSWLFCQEKVLDAGYASKQLLRFLLKQVNEKAESSAKVWVSKKAYWRVDLKLSELFVLNYWITFDFAENFFL